MEDKKDTILAIIGIIFFVVLAIVARNTVQRQTVEKSPTPTTQPTSDVISPTPDESIKKDFQIFDFLNEKNYHFTYTITENEKKEIIDGKAWLNKMKFTIIGEKREEYAKISDNYLKLIYGKYELVHEEVRNYFPYINLDKMQDILKLSDMKQEDNIQIFSIDTPDLLDYYTDIDYTGFEEFHDNMIRITVENERPSKIELDYSNYFSYLNHTTSTFKVVIELNEWGNIEELEI